MARQKNVTALAGGTWTLLFDSTASGGADGESPTAVVVRNASGSANSAEVLVVPLHKTNDGAPGGGDEGVVIAAGAREEFVSKNGAIRQVWAKSDGADVGHFPTAV